MYDAQLNLFADTFQPIPRRILTLAQALDEIRSGVYAERIAFVRKMLARGEQSYRAAKEKLPAFTFAGTFTPTRKITHLQRHSGIVHADLDHTHDLAATKAKICADPRTVYAFISPRGDGLKFGVHVPVVPDDPTYKHAWQVVATTYEQLYGGEWDPSGKDISRLCYVSHDPDLYANFDADGFDVPPAPTPEPTPKTRSVVVHSSTHPQDSTERAIQTAVEMIQTAQLGTRHHTRLRVARLLGGFVAGGLLTDERAYGVLAQALVGHTDNLVAALKTVEAGLAYGKDHPITLKALETERLAWLEAHRKTSPTSRQPPVKQDPWAGMRTLPLKPYRGLRLGKAVRRG
jgi:hypothetical protein